MPSLANIIGLQYITDKTASSLFGDACLLDEDGNKVLQEDGVSCVTMENASGDAAAPDIEGIPVILGVPTEGQVLTATSSTITGIPTPTVSWQWETATQLYSSTEQLSNTNDFGNTSEWIQVNTTRTSGQSGYDETSNAWEITRSATGDLVLASSDTFTGLHTFSLNVKINPNNGIAIGFGGTSRIAYFDIADEHQTEASRVTGNIANSSIKYLGGDFYNISATVDATAHDVRIYSTDADGLNLVSTGATYIVQDASVRQGYEDWSPIRLYKNLLLHSNQFDTTWTTSTTLTSGKTGYDGSSDAWEVSKSSQFHGVDQSFTVEETENTFSVYAKAGTLSKVTIRLDIDGSKSSPEFDLSAGTVISDAGLKKVKIYPVVGSWYRLYVTADGNMTSVSIRGDVSQTSGTIFIQDAQLQESNTATDYIESVASQGTSGIDGTDYDYTIAAGDVDNYLRVVQSAENSEGLDVETSVSTSQIEELFVIDADYQLVLDDATDNGYVLPSASQQVHQSTLIEDLKTAGIWSKLDGLWVYANNASTSDFALYNWVDKTRATIVNTVPHAGDGFTGTGAGWIDTNHVAGVTGSNFQANSASWGIYHNTLYNTTTSNQYPLSSQSSNQRLRYANFSSGGNKMMTSNQLVAVPSSGVGLSGMQKTASGSAQGLDSAGSLTTLETGLGDVALATGNLLNLRFISTAAFSGNLGLCWVGDQLTATEWADFVTAVETYMTNKDS